MERVGIKVDIKDFSVGDCVEYDGEYPEAAPKYLKDYKLYVAKINRKRLRVECEGFPNEYWDIPPCFLKKVTN